MSSNHPGSSSKETDNTSDDKQQQQQQQPPPQKDSIPQLGALEEDDEFEEFAAEGKLLDFEFELLLD